MATYQVEFAYSGVEEDELTLEIGDLIANCFCKEDGWLEGELNGKRGMFPDNFVKKLPGVSTQMISPKAKQAPPPIPSNKPKSLRTQSKRLVYKALFAYRSENGDELTFEEGQKIYFLQEVEDGWARGELDDGSQGLYPTNFVQAAPELDVDKEVVPKPDLKPTNKPKKEAADALYYKVAFEYHADNSDELSLSVGDVIKVLKKESADEGWWEGENCVTGSVGVFPKNFMDQTPIAAPGSKSTAGNNTGPINRINKTVIMRDTKQTNKDVRRNIVSDMPVSTNKPMMDNDKVKNRPKGPNNRRPPKKKAMDDRNPTSPLEENPPLEDQLESKIKAEPSSSPAPAAGAPGQNRSPMMPAINFGSLRKKQAQMGLRTGPEKPVDTTRSIAQPNASPPGPTSGPTSDPASEESAIPPWKKELQAKNAKRGKSIKPTSSSIPEKPPTNEAQQPPPWVKEMEKKKSSFTREDIKPETAIKKEPGVTSSPKPQPIAGTRSSFRPSAPSTTPSFASTQSVTATPPPTAPHKAQSRTESSATSGGGEPTMSDLLREIQSLKSHVQTLSRRLDEESNLRTMLEKKVNSLQRD